MIEKRQSPFESLKHEDERGEYWMGRELMPVTGYEQWRNFQRAINDARSSMTQRGYSVTEEFLLVSAKTSDQGGRPGTDFRLTRTACHFVFMNGDPRKPEIAAAQEYFVLQTQRMEAVEAALPARMPTLPEALRGWADEVEARERAELAAQEAEMLAAIAREEAEELRPPAEAWESLVDTGQDYDVATAASILNRDPNISTGRTKLFRWMIDSMMLYRRAGGQLVPYAAHLEHLRLKPQSRPDHDASDSRARKEAHAQVRVTVRGLQYIQQCMREEAKPDLVQVLPEVAGNVVRLHGAR